MKQCIRDRWACDPSSCAACQQSMLSLDTSTKEAFKESLREMLGRDANRYSLRLALKLNWSLLGTSRRQNYDLLRLRLSTCVARSRFRVLRRKNKFLQAIARCFPPLMPSDVLRLVFSFYTYT